MITEYNDNIGDLIEDEEELYMEETNACTFQMTVKTCEEKVKAYLHEDNISNDSITKAVCVKLPKVSIKLFNGESLKWRTFIEQFEAMIDIKEDLSEIEKFTYLKGYFRDSALEAISGLPLTMDNYTRRRKYL